MRADSLPRAANGAPSASPEACPKDASLHGRLGTQRRRSQQQSHVNDPPKFAPRSFSRAPSAP
eukprot:11650536-Alexandrium_andersonii.AAC.1